MACPNVGVELKPERVEKFGEQKCSPQRDPAFVLICPEYTLTYPAHHEAVKKEGFQLGDAHKLDVMKQKLKCEISSDTITEGPAKGQTFYIGKCVPDGKPEKHSTIEDLTEKPCG